MNTWKAGCAAMVVAMIVSLGCSKPHSAGPSTLTFVIEEVADESWSHFDDGSFEVQQTVTARLTEPGELRGRTVRVQLNALAADGIPKIGTTWSVTLPSLDTDDDLLQTLVYERLTQAAGKNS